MSRISQGCQVGEAPWTERRTVATCWFSRVRVGVSNCRWGPLAGRQCSVRSRWDRRVPVTVGEVAVSLQGRGCSWVGWPGWGRFCWLLGRGVLPVAVRPGRGSSCWQLVGAFCWVAMRPGWLVGPGEVCSLLLPSHSLSW